MSGQWYDEDQAGMRTPAAASNGINAHPKSEAEI